MMPTVSDFFREQNFQSFERRNFEGHDYYAVEPDYYNDGITRSRLYVCGSDKINYNGTLTIVPLYQAVWSRTDNPAVSPCRSLQQEEYRILDIAYFVNFQGMTTTYELSDGKWRICEKGEFRYQIAGPSKLDDVRHFLKLGYAPSLLEWYAARIEANNPDKPAILLLTELYYQAENK